MFFDRIGTSSAETPQQPKCSGGRLAALGLAATMALSASLAQISRLYADDAAAGGKPAAPADGAAALAAADAGARPAAAADAAAPATQPSVEQPAAAAPAPEVPKLSPHEAYKLGQQQFRKGDWINARKNLQAASDAGYKPGFLEGPSASDYLSRMDKKEAADRAKSAAAAVPAPAPSEVPAAPEAPAPVVAAPTTQPDAHAAAPAPAPAAPAVAPDASAAAPTTQPETPAAVAPPVAPAAPEEPSLSARQYYARAREEFRKGDWIAARKDFEGARDGHYRPGLFEDSPANYLARMDKKESADRAETERKLALQRQQDEAQAQQQAILKPVPADAAPSAEPGAAPTTAPAVAVAPTPAHAENTPSPAPAVDASREQRALEELKSTSRAQEIQRQQDQYESQQLTQKALNVQNSDLDQARDLYSRAVSLDADNAQARAGLSHVLILQGRSTQNVNALDLHANRIGQDIQEITYAFDQAIADARAAIANKDFGAASNYIQRAQVARNQNPGIFTPEALRNFDTQIKQTQLALDQASEQAKQKAITDNDKAAEARLQKQHEAEEQQRRRTVADLRATAMRLTEEGRYREALGVIDQILVLDPNNEYAIGVRPLLEDKYNFQQQRLFMQQKDLNLTKQLNAAEEKMIPYDDILRYPSDWPDISQTRDATVQAERGDNKEDRAVQAQLDRPLPELTFDGVGFNDVVDFLRDVSGANIFVNWKSLEGAGIDRNAPVTAKLRNVKFSKALNIILDSVGGGTTKLGYTIDDGVITIATAEELGKNTVTRVYDIRDLIINIPDFTDAPDFSLTSQSSGGGQGGGGAGGGGGGGGGGGQGGGLFASGGQQQGQEEKGPTRQELVDQIIKLITDTVSPDSWRDAGGSVGSIKELSGQLIVTQTPENQRQLVNLLEQLRETRAIQVTVETRFLTVQRNFLDDVGVDLNFIFNVNGANTSKFGGAGGPGSGIPVIQQSSQFTQLPTTGVPGSIGNLPIATTATGLSTAITYLDDFQVSLLLRATEVSNTATDVTAPRVTLFNGQRAYVLVATQKAYVSNLTAAVGTGISSFTPTVSVVETGVLLDVSATVSADRKYVTLTLRPELSNLLDIEDFTFQNGGSTLPGGTANNPIVVGGVSGVAPTGTIQVPEIQLTEVKTTVSVPDGGTLLLGGQTLAGEVEKEAGVPVLSKIPFLKRLFTNRSMAKDEQILLILVKPTILIEKEIEQHQFPLLTSKLGT